MPLVQLDAPALAAQLATLEPDLAYLFDELDVPELVQANLAHRRVRKLGVFAKVEATEDAFRAWPLADLGLDPATGVGARATVAQLAEAWEAAKQR